MPSINNYNDIAVLEISSSYVITKHAHSLISRQTQKREERGFSDKSYGLKVRLLGESLDF